MKLNPKMKIRAIISLMGWPADNLTVTLKKIVGLLRDKMGWTIKNEHIAAPENVSEKMFSSFIEFEAEVKNLNELVLFVLAYGPTTVEILEPSEVFIESGLLQDLLADISAKVQELDRGVKVLSAQNAKMTQLLGELQKGQNKQNES